jgi:hypothetical protein
LGRRARTFSPASALGSPVAFLSGLMRSKTGKARRPGSAELQLGSPTPRAELELGVPRMSPLT